jgi:hypothetical protein
MFLTKNKVAVELPTAIQLRIFIFWCFSRPPPAEESESQLSKIEEFRAITIYNNMVDAQDSSKNDDFWMVTIYNNMVRAPKS